MISRSLHLRARAEALHNPQVDKWIEDGLLICHPGDQVDFDEVERDIVEMSERYNVGILGLRPDFRSSDDAAADQPVRHRGSQVCAVAFLVQSSGD